MRARCNNPKNHDYVDYGGRGISICARWNSFANFFADMGPRPPGLTVDRIDVNGNYEPGNCRWATSITQARNKRTSLLIEFDGTTRPLMEWCEIYNIDRTKVQYRLKQGWSFEDAFSDRDFRR